MRKQSFFFGPSGVGEVARKVAQISADVASLPCVGQLKVANEVFG